MKSFLNFWLKPRYLPLPSFATMLLSLIVLTVICFFIGKNLAIFLSPNDLKDARIAVVEGWLQPAMLSKVTADIKRKNYELIVTTGGGIEESFYNIDEMSFAERTKQYLIASGIDAKHVVALPAPYAKVDRTYYSAVLVRDWLVRNNYDFSAVNVYSGYAHGYRTRYLYQTAFKYASNHTEKNTQFGVYSALGVQSKLEGWWQESQSAKIVVGELAGLLKAWLWFDPEKIENNKCFEFNYYRHINSDFYSNSNLPAG